MFPCQGSYLPQTLSGLFPQVLAWVLQSCSTLLVITNTSSPWTSSPDNIPGQPVFPLPAGPFLTGSQPKHVPCFVLSPSCHCLSLYSALPSHLSPAPSVPLAESRALCSSPAQRPYPPSVYLRIVKSTLFSHPLSFSSPSCSCIIAQYILGFISIATQRPRNKVSWVGVAARPFCDPSMTPHLCRGHGFYIWICGKQTVSCLSCTRCTLHSPFSCQVFPLTLLSL